MDTPKIYHLFDVYGIELEYMITDKNSLSVLPVTDAVIHHEAKEYVNDVKVNGMEWSNELVLHVIELKTDGPVKTLDNLSNLFHKNVLHINEILKPMHGQLMPGPMHPWMDPYDEMKLWPYDNGPIYDAYNRIFDCRGHGWANLQSMHINLPFANDDEFGRLHAAIRLILPILPALAAASPIADGKKMPFSDYRLEVYRKNQSKVPSIAGKVIPEAVFTKSDYENQILQPLYHDISKYDPDGTLQEEWLNSRGAIARFDRNTIEIRVLDIQECPQADIAIAAFIIETLKALVSEKLCPYKFQQIFHEDDLSYILLDNIIDAENAEIHNHDYLRAFGINSKSCTSGDLWKHIFKQVMNTKENLQYHPALNTLLEKGTLSARILDALNHDYSHESLKKIYGKLRQCLVNNEMLG